jgi:hypothetical protein
MMNVCFIAATLLAARICAAAGLVVIWIAQRQEYCSQGSISRTEAIEGNVHRFTNHSLTMEL